MKAIKCSRLLVYTGLLCSILVFSACRENGRGASNREGVSSQVSTQGGQPQITFAKELHEFGSIFSGERVLHSFRFTNTGDAPLVITGTRSSCGCTVGDYSREPIPPGEEGYVSVNFNSAGRGGFQSETLYVQTNIEGPDARLRITAEVIRN